ncbi:hypothetical protein HanIR_Chr02g0092071 [Helianthus annuus]|nr:hypothetical protein HanIR_Chr02g0092071 [Helianthus annuus]
MYCCYIVSKLLKSLIFVETYGWVEIVQVLKNQVTILNLMRTSKSLNSRLRSQLCERGSLKTPSQHSREKSLLMMKIENKDS